MAIGFYPTTIYHPAVTQTNDTDSATLRRPTHGEALAHVETAVERGDLVTMFGRCTVDYDGRAESYLGPGDRLVVLKPDGTTLVHTEEGQKPVNWQPPGGILAAELVDGQLRVGSRRTNPSESLEVQFERLVQVSAFDVADAKELSLAGTEEDLRRRILDDPDLVESGFTPLATERQTAAGAIDIYGKDADGITMVVELKRRRVGPDAVGQLRRYVDALHRDLHAEAEVRGVLVAPSVTERARNMLAESGLEFVPLEP
ncbi:endonuclease NucS [Haladaptatus sp. CMAA 1911]|uniref:endonuclease NucS n=1 Tax=unclassified Haladaptatus TaxID=2622732 RepID=UPI00375479F1